jgi:hypothetical protein
MVCLLLSVWASVSQHRTIRMKTADVQQKLSVLFPFLGPTEKNKAAKRVNLSSAERDLISAVQRGDGWGSNSKESSFLVACAVSESLLLGKATCMRVNTLMLFWSTSSFSAHSILFLLQSTSTNQTMTGSCKLARLQHHFKQPP